MTKQISWGAIVLSALIWSGVLWWVAGYRFATLPVMPPLPAPDYAVQAAWCVGTIPLVLFTAIVFGVIAARAPKSRGAFLLGGCSVMASLTLAGILFAFAQS
jgi:hypothetical protein